MKDETDSDYYDFDDEELYGELEEFVDNETGERYTRNPFTGAKVWVD